MLKLLIALSLLTTVVAAACGGGDGDGLEAIKRLDFDGMELTVAESYNSALAKEYPRVIANINGEEISGQELVARQVETEIARRLSLETHELVQESILTEINGADPLEQLVERELLAQAAERLGYTISRARAVQVAEHLDFLASNSGTLREEWIAMARGRGWPEDNWAESDVVISELQRSGAILAVQDECGPPVPDYSRSQINRDCAAFLAAERESADIEYFVVWAE